MKADRGQACSIGETVDKIPSRVSLQKACTARDSLQARLSAAASIPRKGECPLSRASKGVTGGLQSNCGANRRREGEAFPLRKNPPACGTSGNSTKNRPTISEPTLPIFTRNVFSALFPPVKLLPSNGWVHFLIPHRAGQLAGAAVRCRVYSAKGRMSSFADI